MATSCNHGAVPLATAPMTTRGAVPGTNMTHYVPNIVGTKAKVAVPSPQRERTHRMGFCSLTVSGVGLQGGNKLQGIVSLPRSVL